MGRSGPAAKEQKRSVAEQAAAAAKELDLEREEHLLNSDDGSHSRRTAGGRGVDATRRQEDTADV